MAELVYSVFGQSGGDTVVADTNSYTFGLQFTLSQNAALTGIWWYSPSGATVLPTSCGIYLAADPSAGSGVLVLQVSSPAWSGGAGSGWVKCAFNGQETLFAGLNYKACVQTNGGGNFYASTSGFWSGGGVGASGLTSGIITAPNSAGSDGGQTSDVTPSTGSILKYPTSNSGQNLWLDVEVTTGIAGPVPPVPGFALDSPRTWNPGDQVTTPRLRADLYNLAGLMTQGRPMVTAFNEAGGLLPANTATAITGNSVSLNTWDVIFQNAGEFYPVPLPGWYLLQGWLGQYPFSGGAATTFFSWGMEWSQGTLQTTTRTDFGDVTNTSSGAVSSASLGIGNSGTELVQLNPATTDVIGVYAFSTNSTGTKFNLAWGAEWVGLPSSGTISGVATGVPPGTVITSPKPASLWPPGPGGTLRASVAAGGSILAIGPVPGLRAGGTIGVDWLLGQQYQPYAETVPVQSVAGGTVTLSGTLSYAHNAGAPVAIPVSAALLNEQIRDQVNFLFYPPILRAVSGTVSQSIPNNAWTTVNLVLSGNGIPASNSTVDNFSGFSSNTYTVPVSGLYLVAGVAYLTGTSTSYAAGASIFVGATQYFGDLFAVPDSAGNGVSVTVRRMIRMTAGQQVTLRVFQNTGSNLATDPGISGTLVNFCRLIVVFRSF